ncbi:phage major capsid protein [Companilactobacillus furfuricola]|uniref:phage major capsid family protein n=1 Tax=Companilactobacillus furfuricola TaxID=1462575 RepID=UPI000F7B1492|nr:phage major capsid protein [Companilactobacillus furfuricola]
MTTSKGNLFEPTLVTDLIDKVKGRSSLALLSGQKPIPFNGQKEFTFTMDNDIDIVAENGKKTEGGASLAPVTIVPLKVEYGARVSDEFMYATEEEKIDILKSFNDGYAKKLARGLDLMVFHGINPRTKEASTIIGDNSLDKKVTQTVEFDEKDPDKNIEDAVKLIQGSDNLITGMAIDSQFSSALAQMRDGNNNRLFPTLAWGANPGSINGLQTDINNTVSAGSDDYAILGDFTNMFQWGFSKQIPMDVIQYGDPDNSGKDLKGYNQVYLRSETYLGWGIMDGASFARVIKLTTEG